MQVSLRRGARVRVFNLTMIEGKTYMTWKKGPNDDGAVYYSSAQLTRPKGAECIVWRRDKAPLCKYLIRKVPHGKGLRWQLWQWDDTTDKFALIPEPMARLRHAQEKAAWLERKDARAGVRPDQSSPIEAAAAEFAASMEA